MKSVSHASEEYTFLSLSIVFLYALAKLTTVEITFKVYSDLWEEPIFGETSAIREQQTCYEELQVFMKKVVPEYFEKCCDPSCK
ncbi:hypothetical protein DAPPUDRAFT_263676 [Daphnia pulex]|uniref:Uncharacterized protein n=1 Tax=Daphnia pulex TaxID=6669 RepID=E9HQ78_DAPPU|nr:hypothetical protein DAPPUDRAFT_263676 [Daphnia pulex]|eukprot:EFX66106.1 hypothetical protein DAPPUDRAFT_263676 [Daphnia pulex]